jgi:hypothetical protein
MLADLRSLQLPVRALGFEALKLELRASNAAVYYMG